MGKCWWRKTGQYKPGQLEGKVRQKKEGHEEYFHSCRRNRIKSNPFWDDTDHHILFSLISTALHWKRSSDPPLTSLGPGSPSLPALPKGPWWAKGEDMCPVFREASEPREMRSQDSWHRQDFKQVHSYFFQLFLGAPPVTCKQINRQCCDISVLGRNLTSATLEQFQARGHPP